MNKSLGQGATQKEGFSKGKTDWERLRAMPDSGVVFTDDAPSTSPEDWVNAVAHHGLPVPSHKTQIALRVDDDVIAWFKSQGVGYQTRMNAVLKAFRDAHKGKQARSDAQQGDPADARSSRR